MTTQINAWSIRRYGGPEQLEAVTREIPEPTGNEVIIRILASAVTRADGMMREGTPKFARAFLGFGGPKNDLAGSGLSGEVIAVGPEVSRFSVGDEVFGEAGMKFGANATHICLAEDGVLMHKPEYLSHEEAAVMCDGPLTSFNFLEQVAELHQGERILILGGAGSLGSAAVQIAAKFGAEVTATCSGRNVGLVASMGARRVIDYTVEGPFSDTAKYDVIFDTLGVSSFAESKRNLTMNGRYVCPVLTVGLLGAMLRTSVIGKRKARFSATGMLKPSELRQMLVRLLELVESGDVTPMIDRTYPLDQLVEAHNYVDAGHKRGNVVVV